MGEENIGKRVVVCYKCGKRIADGVNLAHLVSLWEGNSLKSCFVCSECRDKTPKEKMYRPNINMFVENIDDICDKSFKGREFHD